MTKGVIKKVGAQPRELRNGEVYPIDGGWGTIEFVDGKKPTEPGHEAIFSLQPTERIGAPPIGLPVEEGRRRDLIFDDVRYTLIHDGVSSAKRRDRR